MTDERDPKVTAAYRSLGAEEPPRALDEAILAAARRPRISPARTWTQRWARPLSLAAVVVLSVTVTLQMQLEQPGIDGLQAPQPAPPAAERAQPPSLGQKEDQAKPQARLEARRAEPKPFADASADRAPAAAAGPATTQAPAAPPSAESGNLASRDDAGSGAALAKRSAPAAAARPAPAQAAETASAPAAQSSAEQAAKLSGETPERELERIAQLRAEGKHDEADKALAEFRKRYPDYKIAGDVLRRVERR